MYDGWELPVSGVHSHVLLLLFVSYHRCLRTISEALELRVEGGQDSHIWCMSVASHGYGGGRDGGGGWFACGTNPSGMVAYHEMPEHVPSVR